MQTLESSFTELTEMSAEYSFAPSELYQSLIGLPRLAPWPAFYRRFAAGRGNSAADSWHKSYSIIFKLIDANYE
jgi:predicted component of type VI protein secretion system